MDKKNLIIKLFKSLRGEKEKYQINFRCYEQKRIINERQKTDLVKLKQ